MKPSTVFLIFIIVCLPSFSQSTTNNSTLLTKYTSINDNNVNIRELPTTKSKVLTKLNKDTEIVITGISEKAETIDGMSCYWLRISQQENENPIGWVFAKFVTNGNNLKPSILKYKGYSKYDYPNSIKLNILFEVNRREINDEVLAYYDDVYKYYTFSYTTENFIKYDWHCIPGTYIYFPKNGEIRHIAYVGVSDNFKRILLTNDHKYLIELDISDSGSIWTNTFEVWDIQKNKKIYQGNYYNGDTDIRDTENNHIIKIAYEYFEYGWDHGDVDSELKDYADRNRNLALVAVICKLNLDTMERKIFSVVEAK